MIYDKLAKYYDRAFAPFERRFLNRWRAETLGLLPEGAAILEIGAGTGANFPFYPRFRHAVSSEISIKMLEIARTKAVAINFVQANAEDLPFGESVFDAAFATLVFCSIPDPAVAFGEVQRVVRPFGRVVLLEHVRPSGAFGYLFDLINFVTVAAIEDHFNRRTAETAKNAGLHVVEVREKAAGVVNLIVCEVVK